MSIFEMPHFSYPILKMGKIRLFKNFEHKKVGHFKKIARDLPGILKQNMNRTEIDRFWGISENYVNDVTCQNHRSHSFWGIS